MIINFDENEKCKTGEIKTVDDSVIYSANSLIESFKIFITPKSLISDIVADEKKFKIFISKMQIISCNLTDFSSNGYFLSEEHKGYFNSVTFDLYIMSQKETAKYEKLKQEILDNVHYIKALNIKISETEFSFKISNSDTEILINKDSLLSYDRCELDKWLLNDRKPYNCMDRLKKELNLYNIFTTEVVNMIETEDLREIV